MTRDVIKAHELEIRICHYMWTFFSVNALPMSRHRFSLANESEILRVLNFTGCKCTGVI